MAIATSTHEASLLGSLRAPVLSRGGARDQIIVGERATNHNAPTLTSAGHGRCEPPADTHGIALPTETRNIASSSRVNAMGRRRTTKGVKRSRYQGRPTQFVGEDYDPNDGRPNWDESGLRDVEGSRPTMRLVVTQGERLRLRAATPRSDDDESTDESYEDPRCVEANDPTVRV